jgi:hypothetical protein
MNALMHDYAMLIAVEVLNLFSGLLREEQQRDALWAIYECLRLRLSEYETKADRKIRRPIPGRN